MTRSIPMGRRIRWGSKTPHLFEIRQAWDAGVRSSVIAELFGFSRGYVSHLARRMGWPRRQRIGRFRQKLSTERWSELAAIKSLQRDEGASKGRGG